MSIILCNAPFCENTRNPNHAWCGEHRWEREKYKVKTYKELLPIWSNKRCKIHGFLKLDQSFSYSKGFRCRQCNSQQQRNRTPEKQKYYNDKYFLKRKNWRLLQRYGITIDHYNSLLIKQNYCCAICKISIEDHQLAKGSNKHFAVDHCHQSLVVRGLLCYRCNMGLGYFRDCPELAKSALSYLTIQLK